MKKLIAMSTLAGALSIAAVADASAWTRSGTSTGPRGTSSVQATGSLRERLLLALGDPHRPGRQHLHPPGHGHPLLTAAAIARGPWPRAIASQPPIPVTFRRSPCPGFPFLRYRLSRWPALASVSAALSVASSAQAQVSPQMRGEAIALMQVCRGDYDRLCAGVQPGGGRVLACLQNHASQLSAACGQAMPRAQALKDSAAAAGVMPK